MFKITAIDYMKLFVPWKASLRDPMGRWRAMSGTTPAEEDAYVVIRMHTDQGLVGLGETWYAASTVQAAVHDHGGGGHHQLEAVFQVKARIVKQDILRAGADVDGEDFHREEVYHK